MDRELSAVLISTPHPPTPSHHPPTPTTITSFLISCLLSLTLYLSFLPTVAVLLSPSSSFFPAPFLTPFPSHSPLHSFTLSILLSLLCLSSHSSSPSTSPFRHPSPSPYFLLLPIPYHLPLSLLFFLPSFLLHLLLALRPGDANKRRCAFIERPHRRRVLALARMLRLLMKTTRRCFHCQRERVVLPLHPALLPPPEINSVVFLAGSPSTFHPLPFPPGTRTHVVPKRWTTSWRQSGGNLTWVHSPSLPPSHPSAQTGTPERTKQHHISSSSRADQLRARSLLPQLSCIIRNKRGTRGGRSLLKSLHLGLISLWVAPQRVLSCTYINR